MPRRSNETPAQVAERMTRRMAYLAACRAMKNPDTSPEDREKAGRIIDEYDVWVDYTLLDEKGHPV